MAETEVHMTSNKKLAKRAQMLVLAGYLREELSPAVLDCPTQLKLLSLDTLLSNNSH